MGAGLPVLLALALSACAMIAGPLTIYTEIAPPNQYLDAEGNLTGYTIELVREIQSRVATEDPIQVVPWVRGYHEVSTRPNVLLFSMARSRERDPLFEWVGPISESSYLFFVKADSGVVIRSLKDAKKLKLIGVYKEDVRDQYLTRLGFTNLDRSLDQEVMLRKLLAGRLDAIVVSPLGLEGVAKKAGLDPGDFRASLEFQKVQTYFAFSKGTEASIVKEWKKSLEAMKQDGAFARIFRKYYPDLPLPGPAMKPF